MSWVGWLVGRSVKWKVVWKGQRLAEKMALRLVGRKGDMLVDWSESLTADLRDDSKVAVKELWTAAKLVETKVGRTVVQSALKKADQ